MPGMRDQFAHFYVPDDDAIATAMRTGLVVPDTNVVLRLYEFTATARDELFEALGNLGDRLWIPYHVGHEVHRKRLEVIAKQEKFFRDTRSELDGAIGTLRKQVGAFRVRLALSKDELKEIEDSIEALQKLIQGEVTKASKANEVRMKDRDSDKVRARLEKLFANRVGVPMGPGELEEARAEAAKRAAKRIPPGYMDADKVDGDPAGDYLIWRQLMTEAKTRGLPVVFVTDDTKEDWHWTDQNIPLGARYELRAEMMREAGVPLLMITTKKFVDYAKKYLGAEFSEETMDQAAELPSVARDVDLLAANNLIRSIAVRDRNPAEVLLEFIATGAMPSRSELVFAMRVLRVELGSAEMGRRVISAVVEGKAKGRLSGEDAMAVLEALERELTIGSDTPSFHAVNPGLPVLRDAFERALEVSPASDDPGEVAQARRTLAMHLERHQATDDDRERARAWLRDYDQWLDMQRSESEGEPPAED
jgi:hypothetical protein